MAQAGTIASYTASGAVAGNQIVPGYGAVVGGVLGFVVGLFSGGGDNGAAAARAAAEYNAKMTRLYGAYNANTRLQAAGLSASMMSALAKAQITAQHAKDVYNINLLNFVNKYNEVAIDREIDLLWDAFELDIHQRKTEERKMIGTYRAMGAASGVEIGNEQDSNTLGQLDMQTQYELDRFILERNVHIQAAKLQDAKAKGRWETALQVNNLIFEGKLNSLSIATNALGQIGTTIGQGILDAHAIRTNADMQAQLTLNEGGYRATQANNLTRQQNMDGWLNAASTVTSYYAKKYDPSKPSITTEVARPSMYKPLSLEANRNIWSTRNFDDTFNSLMAY